MYLTPRYVEWFEEVLDVSGGRAIVMSASGTQSIIDIETGRELFSFRDFGNTTHRVSLTSRGDVAIIVRTRANSVTTGQSRVQRSLIDIESGKTLLSFRNIHGDGWLNFLVAFDGMVAVSAIVEDTLKVGLIDIETGREVIPFTQYTHMQLIGNVVRAMGSEGCNLFLITDDKEAIFLGRYSRNISFTARRGEKKSIAIIAQHDSDWFLVDAENGQKMTLPDRYYHIFHIIDGVAHVGERWTIADGIREAIVELDSGRELIPFGQYDRVVLLSRSRALIVPISLAEGWGVVDFVTGETLIPVGKYDEQWPLFTRWLPIETLVVAYNGQVGLIEVESGNEVIPFGRYDEISVFNNGIIAVSYNGRWRFYCTE